MKKWVVYLILALLLFGLPFIAYTSASEEYVSAKKCKLCHIKIYKSWGQSKHGTAFDVLSPGKNAEAKKKSGLDPQKDYTTDAKCVECHTTGNNAQMPGVQCEVCHGAGKGFTRTGIMNKKLWKEDPKGQEKKALEAGLIIKPEESLCKKCHNEKSPTYKPFNFAERYKAIAHKKD
ncbi:MAG: cytochrome c family protein [Proteobacteria bacterium]|nr:cytochrome c family protein [Pseudomonadota bacterium]